MDSKSKQGLWEAVFYANGSHPEWITALEEQGSFRFKQCSSPHNLSVALDNGIKVVVTDFESLCPQSIQLIRQYQKETPPLHCIGLESLSPPEVNHDLHEAIHFFATASFNKRNLKPLNTALRNLGLVIDLEDSVHALQKQLEETDTKHKQLASHLGELQKEASNALNTKNQFLANMSHEIRTPLNGVIGMAVLLLRTNLNETQRRYSETIRNSSTALLNVIDDILDYSSIDSGSLNIQTIDFQLSRTLEDVCELLAPKAQEKGLELQYLIPPSFPNKVLGDPGRLRQVLSNLIANAIDFTHTGSIVVEVSVETQNHYDLLAKISVRDTGVGIPPEALTRLFNSFEQLDSSATRSHGGAGLGLAICHQLTALMGGRLGVESEINKGSTFWFTLPLTQSIQPPQTHSHNPKTLRGKKLLIAESNPTLRKLLSEQAISWQMAVTTCADGSTALNLLKQAAKANKHYDLVTLDWRMPDMSGLELAHAIKINQSISKTSLILLTTYPQRGHGELAHKAGVCAYLVKPIAANQLRDCFLTLLHRPSEDQSLVTRHSLEETRPPLEHEEPNQLRILVAEDNLVNQEVTVEILHSLGYQTQVAADGQIALDMHLQNPPDLVLMDCMMPNLNGYEATKAIRRREGAQSIHTPVIGVTANAMPGDREKCLTAGMDDYLPKPITPELLANILRKWLPIANSAQNDSAQAAPDQTSEPILAPLSNRSSRVVHLFLQDLPIRLEELERAVQSGDANKLEKEAHILKGTSLVVGAPRLVRLARDLEQIGASTILDSAQTTLQTLTVESKRASDELSSG